MAKPIEKLGLTEIERAASDRILAGEVADFAGAAEKPLLRAAVLDALALASPPRGIRVKNARIEGALDLGDAALPALALDHCDIAAPLMLDQCAARPPLDPGSRHAGPARARGNDRGPGRFRRVPSH